jgi:hypothetical protein
VAIRSWFRHQEANPYLLHVQQHQTPSGGRGKLLSIQEAMKKGVVPIYGL